MTRKDKIRNDFIRENMAISNVSDKLWEARLQSKVYLKLKEDMCAETSDEEKERKVKRKIDI